MVSQTLSHLIDSTTYFFTDVYSKIIIKFTVTIIIILIGFLIGKILGRLTYRLLSDMNLNELLQKGTGISAKMDDIIAKIITYIIYVIAIIIALDVVKLVPGLLYGLSWMLIIIIIFTIIVGIKDIVPNVVAGLSLYKKRNFRPGDTIVINGHSGVIKQINLTETIVEKKNGDLLYVPNSALNKMPYLKKKK